PLGLVIVPIAHDPVHPAAINAAGKAPRLLDEMPEQHGTRPERRLIHITVERLVHAKNELGHRDFSAERFEDSPSRRSRKAGAPHRLPYPRRHSREGGNLRLVRASAIAGSPSERADGPKPGFPLSRE